MAIQARGTGPCLLIFVSSSIPRFKEVRKKLERKIGRIPFAWPWFFENTPATPDPVEESYLQEVWQCHIFVGILDQNVTPGVRAEFDLASECNKRRLIFVSETAPREVLEYIQKLPRLPKYQRFNPENEADLVDDVVKAIILELVARYPEWLELKPIVELRDSLDKPLATLLAADKPLESLLSELRLEVVRGKSPLSMIRLSGSSSLPAWLVACPWWFLRDFGKYRLEWFAFLILYWMGRLSWWRELQYQTAIGLADATMLLRDWGASMRWIKRSAKLANQINNQFYQAMAEYQEGHTLGHLEPTLSAEGYLRRSYKSFMRLSGIPNLQPASLRMASWSALFVGRCLRGRVAGSCEDSQARYQESQDWILTSLILAKVTGHRRQQGYALVQMARLRVIQGCLPDIERYLKLAEQCWVSAVKGAPGDAKWDAPLDEIIRLGADHSADVLPPWAESAYDSVRRILALR